MGLSWRRFMGDARADAITAPAATTGASTPGARVANRYVLRAPIGSGGGGVVWDAADTLSGRDVAVKLMDLQGRASPAPTHVEVWALRMRVPGVVALLDEGVDGRWHFLVMERVEGEPFPGRASPCAWGDLEPVVLRLLGSLGRLHAAGVTHRDLKPSNVLVDAAGRPVILDLGIARIDVASSLGADDAALGTPRYVAPEQVHGVDGPQSDLYALGVMIYEALAGTHPFDLGGRRSMAAFLEARLAGRTVPLRARAPMVPSHVAELCDRMLALDPRDRPRDVAEVLDALRPEAPRAARRTWTPPPVPPPWSAEAMRCIFAQPDPFLHRDEDAASLLSRRTAGDEAAVAAELDAWLDARLVSALDGRLAVSSTLFEREAAGLLPERGATLAGHDDASLARLTSSQRRVARWLQVGGALRPEQLGALTTFELRDVTETLAALRDLAVATPRDDGAWVSARDPRPARVDAHGGDARLRRLLALSDPAREAVSSVEALARETAEAAASLAEDGFLGRAQQVLDVGLRALRPTGARASALRVELLGRWVELAAAELAPGAFDRVLYELHREPQGPEVAALVTLARAAAKVAQGTDEALALAESVRFDDFALEVVRHGVRVSAARRLGPERLSRVSAELASLRAPAAFTDRWAVRLSLWEGRLRYVEGRYEDAARCYERAAAGEQWRSAQANALINAASAWLEAFCYDDAMRCAVEGRALAHRCRHALHAANAEWLVGTVGYRQGIDVEVGDETLDAARAVASDQEVLLAFLAATAAYRRVDRDRFAGLSARLHRAVGVASAQMVTALVDAMGMELGLTPWSEGYERRAGEVWGRCGARWQLQVLALTASQRPAGAWRAADPASLARCVAEPRWRERMDVLSVRECLDRLSAPR